MLSILTLRIHKEVLWEKINLRLIFTNNHFIYFACVQNMAMKRANKHVSKFAKQKAQRH